MTQSSSVIRRHPELKALVQAAAGGHPRPVYLLAGDSFDTSAAAHALLDALVPPASRAFNLETYDGRTTPMSTVIDSLRMPGFFAGTKVVWVRESTIFLSGEKRPELTKALLAAWGAGRARDAADKLLTLAALAGWSQEQLTDVVWSTLAKSRVREVFGQELSPDELSQLDAVQKVCADRGLRLTAYRDDSGALLELVDAGMPPGAVLLITATAVDARKRLFKRLRDVGAWVSLAAARERSGVLTREAVEDLIRASMQACGKRLDGAAHEVIVRRAGADPAQVAMELEKLCLYVGERAVVTEDDVRRVFRDMGESWIFDFTGALSAGRLERALPLLRGLIGQGEPPLRLLAMIAREVRLLLVARECLDTTLRGRWRAGLSFGAFQSRLLPQLDADALDAFGKAHPFVIYRRLQDAARLDGHALRRAYVQLSDLDLRLKSSRGDPAMLLEVFVIDWCRAATPARGGQRAAIRA